MKLAKEIYKLTEYGIKSGLIEENDRNYVINQYLEIFLEDEFLLSEKEKEEIHNTEIVLSVVLENLTNIAYERRILEIDGITQSDLFDTKLMGVMVARPTEIIRKFRECYSDKPKAATDWFYKFSQDTNYIRRDRIKKDRKWKIVSEYGDIDITINLSKPEKDPKAIAAAKKDVNSSYPACQLCVENEGYAGRMNHPARQNHRIIPIEIQESRWGFQYSPYVYYNEHCIVFNGEHLPMKIDSNTFEKLFDFVKLFPHYFVGSNADLPIVGGSILSHDHFQGGYYTFAMENAPIEKTYLVKDFEDVELGILKWPLSVLRLRCKDEKRLIQMAVHILNVWRGYTDEKAFIFAETDGEPHNTITPIARKKGQIYELDLALRNNITTEEHPLGVYHPHAQWHNIKKENIGLIEVMGLAVLPARLDSELELLADYLVKGKNISNNDMIKKHEEWVNSFRKRYKIITEDNVMDILEKEVGKVFVHVLEDAGVYKCTQKGREAFERFIAALQEEENYES